MRDMKTKAQSEIATLPSSTSHFESGDMELTMKAVRGIADAEAGRCSPVAEVRARVMSRYEQSRACM